MNDGKVSKFAIASILMASILTNGIKFSGETKPTFNEVSSKYNFMKKQANKSDSDSSDIQYDCSEL